MIETFIRKQKIRSGKTERLREWIAKMESETEADSRGIRDIWAAESLYTISLFIEHAEDADYLVWYLEAESIEQLISARNASSHPLHDLEDEMMDDVLENPDAVGNFEPLLHGVSPERPNDFVVQQYADES